MLLGLGHSPWVGLTPYFVAKHGVVALTKGLARDGTLQQ